MPPCGLEAVEDPHVGAARQELVDHVGADEPGAAGDQDLHPRNDAAPGEMRPDAAV